MAETIVSVFLKPLANELAAGVLNMKDVAFMTTDYNLRKVFEEIRGRLDQAGQNFAEIQRLSAIVAGAARPEGGVAGVEYKPAQGVQGADLQVEPKSVVVRDGEHEVELDNGPSRRLINSLIVQLVAEGVSLQAIEKDFSIVGASPFDPNITVSPAMAKQILELQARKMQTELQVRRLSRQQAEAGQAQEQEQEQQGVDNGMQPGADMGNSRSRRPTLGPSFSPSM